MATVFGITDGDTFQVTSGHWIRLARVNTPEKGHFGYGTARQSLGNLIPPGTIVDIIPVRDSLGRIMESYGRILAEVYKTGLSVNEAMRNRGYR